MDPFPTTLNPNKQLKEEFVSNLTGSSMLEIAAYCTIVPLFSVLQRLLFSNRSAGCKGFGAYVAAITVDFIFIVLPTLLFLTVLSDWLYASTISLMALIVCFAANRFVPSSSYPGGTMTIRDHISSYRVFTTIVTCLCILAVDFRIFPRRYAKTETYGTGLMDLGVGSFTIANALVSRQARSVSKVNLKAAVQATSPLLLLGFGRLFSTRTVNYQVHTGEYGVHWNFFFTLAAVSILTSVVNIRPKYAGVLGLVILVGYQSWLISGLNLYLLSDKRGADIISKNKEGLFSVLGYWGMYLVGVWLGDYLFFGNRPSTGLKSSNSARNRVWLLTVIFWLITVILDRNVERISRRMCNLAYVSFVLAVNLQVLAILMLRDFVAGSKLSALEEAFDLNLLASFLVANVLTGVVNLCFDTLFASTLSALSILLIYAYILAIVTGIAHHSGVRLKFW